MRVAILTSGGDAQGMNMVLKGALDLAKATKVDLYKVRRGYEGLIDGEISPLTYDDLQGRENDGGSCIMISRSSRFLQAKYRKIAVDNLKKKKISHLIVVGGNGSFRGALDLMKLGVNVICVPATIDNDLNFDMTLGFDSAVNHAVECIDNILDCVNAIGCGVVVEVMGRESGDLATYVGRALNAEYIITNDIPVDYKAISEQIKSYYKMGCTQPVVILQEKFLDIDTVVDSLEKNTGIRFKRQVLGYAQRGGKPSAYDRVYGYELGACAVKLCNEKNTNIAIGRVDGKVQAQDIEKSILSKTKKI